MTKHLAGARWRTWKRDLRRIALNGDKTKEMIIDFRRPPRVHALILIGGVAVERVKEFKFLGVHISDDLSWAVQTERVVKKAQHRSTF